MAGITNALDLFTKAVQSTGEGNVVADQRSVAVLGAGFEEDNHKIRVGLVPAGVEVHDLKLVFGDADDGANLVVDVGYEYTDGSDSSAVDDYFAAASAALQSAGAALYDIEDFNPFVLAKDAFITILVTTPAGGGAGNAITVKSAWKGVTYGAK